MAGEDPERPEGQVPEKTKVMIFWRTGGICLGGVPLKEMGLKRSGRIFVGSESGYDFEDPEGNGHRGRQVDPYTGEKYTNQHCGGCGFIQAAFLRSSINARQGKLDLDNPAHFVKQVLTGSTIRRLAIAILIAIGKAHHDAVVSFRGGGPPEGHIEVICDKGHHRSEFTAEMGAHICKELGYTVAMRRHHLRFIRGFREKEDCRCWIGFCVLPGLSQSWHEGNRRVRNRVLTCMTALILSLQADYLGDIDPVVYSVASKAFEPPKEDSEDDAEEVGDEEEVEPAADSRVSAGTAVPTGSKGNAKQTESVNPSAVAASSNRAATLFTYDDLPKETRVFPNHHERSMPAEDTRLFLIQYREMEVKRYFGVWKMTNEIIRQHQPVFTDPQSHMGYPLGYFVDEREGMSDNWQRAHDSPSEYRIAGRYDILVYPAKRSVNCKWEQVDTKKQELFLIIHAVAINLSSRDVFSDLSLDKNGVRRLDP